MLWSEAPNRTCLVLKMYQEKEDVSQMGSDVVWLMVYSSLCKEVLDKQGLAFTHGLVKLNLSDLPRKCETMK